MVPAPVPPAIRAAVATDAPAIAAILTEALGAKYGPALGSRAMAGLAGLVRDDIVAGVSGFLVAEMDGEPVGAVHLATAEYRPSPGLTRRLAERIGWPRTVRALLVLSLLRPDPLAADEGHIGELGVAAPARRRGVASALLAAAEARAVGAGKRRLTLWVTGENTGAIALYERSGYRVVVRRRWPVGSMVFRASGLLMMEKRIEGEA